MNIKSWLKENWILCAILVLALLIRLWFFYITFGHPIWFDESEYGSYGKLLANHLNGNPYEINPQRPPLFMYSIAGFFAAGFENLAEPLIILFLVLLPSLLLVYAIFLLGREMFNKKVGLIASALAAVSWTFLFWSNRIQPDFLSMCFQVLAVIFMWKYWKSQYKSQTPPVSSSAAIPGELGATAVPGREERFFKKYAWVICAGACTAAAFYFKVSALLVPMVFMVFIALKDRFSAFKDKGYWIYAATFILFMLPYFLWAYSTFGDPFAFKLGYIDAPTDFPEPGWYNLKFYMTLTSGGLGNGNIIMYIIFLAACVLAGLKVMLSLDFIVKDKTKAFDAKLFCLLVFIVVSCFYIFYMRNTDDRWVYLWMPFIFMMIGWVIMEGVEKIGSSIFKKYSKKALILTVCLLVIFMMFVQYQHADELIKYKADSYGPVKEASMWIKANSPPEAKVLSISYPQTVYYTERNVSTYSILRTKEEFQQYVIENKPQFLMVSIFEPHPAYVYEWVDENTRNGNIIPVQGYWADEAKTRPVLIVYFINGIDNNRGEFVSLPEINQIEG